MKRPHVRMKRDYDIAVIGSGFGGSLTAMIARRLGLSVVLLERGRHPRVVIGESSTPLANLLLEELATRYDLPALLPLSKWGTWQAAHPHIACGLKRGFTFYHHRWNEPFSDDASRSRQLLVAASPNDRIADTHWWRADFDQFLVQTAQSLGVEYLDEVRLASAVCKPDGVMLSGTRDSSPVEFKASFVVDATGPRGFLHHALGLSEAGFDCLPKTQALYSHFTGVSRFDVSPSPPSPYPPDDAALHHVFPGGWMWVLHFNNGMTSAGVAVTESMAGELRLNEDAAAWGRLMERLPSVAAQFRSAGNCRPWTYQPRLSFRSGQITGPNWALLPSSAGFVDPLLSTGFPLTLLGIERLARSLESNWGTARFAAGLSNYAAQSESELLITADLVGALYANLEEPAVFNALTLLYFAAASYSETVRRLGRAQPAGGFLLHDHVGFGPAMRQCLEQARCAMNAGERESFIRRITEMIEPINVAGLARPGRRNWYPAHAQDLFDAATKLGATHGDIERMLARCGFEDDVKFTSLRQGERA